MKPTSKPNTRYDSGDLKIALVAFLAVVAIASVTSGGTGLGAGLLFAGLLAGSFASVVVHELGHAVAAWAVGWGVWIISALPIVVRLGHAPRFSTKLSHDVGGYVLGSPPTAALDRPWRSVVFTAGGPLASLLTGPLFIYWLSTLPQEQWETPTGAGMLGAMLAFGFYGAMSAAWTLWPFGVNGRPNDMVMILTALTERNTRAATSGPAWAWALFAHGVEPSAWPAWVRDVVLANTQGPWASPVTPVLAFADALERNDETAARQAARRGNAEFGPMLKAYVSAYFDSDPSITLPEVDPKRTPEQMDWLRALTEARVLALNDDMQGEQRVRDKLALDISKSGAPQPFWEQLLER